MTAREHAERADALLLGVRQLSEALDAMSAAEKLEAAATGRFLRLNRDIEWTTQLAATHALTALALSQTGAP